MAITSEKQALTHEEYFLLEEREDRRYEYLAGEVFAMTGGTETHTLISANAIAVFLTKLRDKSCRVYGSDIKLRIKAHDKFCYPDVMFLCKEGIRHVQFIENPICIIEVLSESTESYDRGLKFEHYRTISTLRYYLLLSQDRIHAELFERDTKGKWRLSEASGADGRLDCASLDIILTLAELYRRVDFTET